jgi:aspartate racemase
MAEQYNSNLLGVVGGLGPLASAEFLKTIYEYGLGEREQSAPAVLMLSDPSFPDRTQTLLDGGDELLLGRLADALGRLSEMGVSQVVICCITLHHVVPRLPAHMRARVVSLLDVIFDSVKQSRSEHLLVCTTGTRRLGVFQRHECWERTKSYFVLPDEKDQAAIHDLIYRVKRNEDLDELAPLLDALLSKYGVGSFIAGCTEIHLLAKRFLRESGRQCIDPLIIIAQAVAQGGLARLA